MRSTGLIRIKKTILPLSLLLTLLLCTLGLTACAGKSLTEQDIRDMGYSVEVVLDYGGGTVSDADKTRMLLKPDSYVPEPGKPDSGLAAVVRADYSFKHFCEAKTDENGQPLKDADGKPIPDETKVWDFGSKVSRDITLCATWWKNFTMLLHYGNISEDYTKTDYTEVKEVSVPRERDGRPTQIAAASARVTGYTVVDYYLDENENTEIEFPNTLAFDDDNPTIDVWGKSLKGNFQVIRSEAAFAGLNIGENTNIYLTVDVDMADKKITFPADYAGKFYGNGHTIDNLTVEQSARNRRDTDFGIFKRLASGAEIVGLTLSNVHFTAKLSRTDTAHYTVGLLAGVAQDGSTVRDVTVTGLLRYSVTDGYDSDKIITVKEGIGEVQSGAEVAPTFVCAGVTIEQTAWESA